MKEKRTVLSLFCISFALIHGLTQLPLTIENASAETPIPVVRHLPDNPNPVQGACKDLRKASAVSNEPVNCILA